MVAIKVWACGHVDTAISNCYACAWEAAKCDCRKCNHGCSATNWVRLPRRALLCRPSSCCVAIHGRVSMGPRLQEAVC